MNTVNTKILIVEDDLRLQQLLYSFLLSEKFDIAQAMSGQEAITLTETFKPDIILLDIMLPDMDGLAVAREVLPTYQGAIIVLTADNQEITEILALNLGVDDFISKPVRPHVLLARIKALMRRVGTQVVEGNVTEVQDLQLNHDSRQLLKDDGEIVLTGSEYELISVLIANAGSIVSRNEILASLKGISYNAADRTVDMGISALRKKLNDEIPPYRYIKTVRGKGYVFTKE